MITKTLKSLVIATMLLLTSVSFAGKIESINLNFTAEIDPNVSAGTFTRWMMDNDTHGIYYRPQGEIKFDLQLNERIGDIKIAFTKLYEVSEPELDTPPSKIKTFEVNAKCVAPEVIKANTSMLVARGQTQDVKVKILKVTCFTMLDPVRSVAGEPGDLQLYIRQFPNGSVHAWMTILDENRDMTYHLFRKK